MVFLGGMFLNIISCALRSSGVPMRLIARFHSRIFRRTFGLITRGLAGRKAQQHQNKKRKSNIFQAFIFHHIIF
jgi:hypothetical protein